ncbi:hypothetical protein Ade02nite_86740 [Paractinoplanes deccanensis]|uniref:HTH cro/C1-type domain-containing protein n=1 Tax=Paractinoplanes deccanensis TaxID=113561 RepID=A0ABQ3YJ38_9ACTN|nr:helix-turn-helix domain-containing protein [Actinoplanes deccanensis]GID80033.1 hypothetical protein Ade02nite_86740 [Actinoplanes deccanensis]
MRVDSPSDLGSFIRYRRKAAGLSQTDLASRAEVSRRWLCALEAGKPTAEIGLVLRVIAALGFFLDARPRPEPVLDLDAYLGTLGASS